MGPTLEDTRRDLRYMPTQYLTQVAQSPNDRVIGDIPLKTLAGLELSRRAQMQSEMAAMGAPNAQMPTVLNSTIQSLSPQPQQPMPPQGMPPPQQPMPQQAAPQPQPQQPPQPQQQQQPPQAKQPPIMGLPAMQAPKKMAGGGIIAFSGEERSDVPKAEEEATSALGDMMRDALRGPEKNGKNAREVEWEAAKTNPNTWFNLATAMTPSERAARAEKAAALRREASDIRGVPVDDPKKEVAKAEGNKEPKIQNVPDSDGGIAAFMKAFGGMGGGGGGGGSSKQDSETRKRLADIVSTDSAEQQAFRASALKRAGELENYQAPTMSKEERRAFLDEEFGRNQAYSKPHFDMMQKLIDEEKASNNAGKESEVYRMLGKMGGALMSSRGAFGPALGRAVGEGIDYSDKADAARAAAERLRRQAQMDLVKSRMLDEKGDRQGAQALLTEHDRAMQAASKLTMETRLASTNLLKDVAASDSRKQLEALKLGNQLDMSEQRAAARAQSAGLTNQLGIARLMMQYQQGQDRNRPTQAERIAADKRAEEVFSNPSNPNIPKFIALTRGGPELLKSIEMGITKPNDPKYQQALLEAQELYKQYLSQGTRTGGDRPSGMSYDDAMSRFGG